MTTSLVLAFKTSDSKICNIRINNPKSAITRAQATAVMQDIIARKVFQTSTGATLVAIDSIYTVETTKSEILV